MYLRQEHKQQNYLFNITLLDFEAFWRFQHKDNVWCLVYLRPYQILIIKLALSILRNFISPLRDTEDEHKLILLVILW